MKKIVAFSMCFMFAIVNVLYAGTFYYENSSPRYRLDSGALATNSWIWIDTNMDSIAECYRFDENGDIAKNYVDSYGRSIALGLDDAGDRIFGTK